MTRNALLCAVVMALICPTSAETQEVPSEVNIAGKRLLVRVVTSLERAPLGYSVIALPTLGIERFTGAGGSVSVTIPSAGRVRLVVKRLGFVPKDTTISVNEAPSQSVEIALARLSFKLEAVRVIAWPECRRPGISRLAANSLERGVVEQIRQNAERYRLLTRNYPFIYTSVRTFSRRTMEGEETVESSDTLQVDGAPDWRYRPGTLVERNPIMSMLSPDAWIMHIPTVSDLAEDRFVDNHCFHVAGLEDKEGTRMLRVEIIAAARLKGPDVNAVVWLDSVDFQLRHATFTLTKPPPQLRGLLHSETRVSFEELIPFVPVMGLTVGENLVQRGRSRTETIMLVEEQRLLRIIFLGDRPPDSEPGVRP